MTVQPLVVDTIVTDGASYRVSWFDPPFHPPLRETTQALGICFTPASQIVLVTWNGVDWTLPGGTIEPGETLEQTLTREVREEACAQVLACAYIGCQRVEPLDAPDGDRAPYYQTRFWARVRLDPFTPTHEMTAHTLVSPDGFSRHPYVDLRGGSPPVDLLEPAQRGLRAGGRPHRQDNRHDTGCMLSSRPVPGCAGGAGRR